MELSFATTDLREVCEQREVATAKFGPAVAFELGQVIAEIDASTDCSEYITLFNDVVHRSATELMVRLKSGYKLILRSGHPRDASVMQTDWDKVTRIRIHELRPDE